MKKNFARQPSQLIFSSSVPVTSRRIGSRNCFANRVPEAGRIFIIKMRPAGSPYDFHISLFMESPGNCSPPEFPASRGFWASRPGRDEFSTPREILRAARNRSVCRAAAISVRRQFKKLIKRNCTLDGMQMFGYARENCARFGTAPAFDGDRCCPSETESPLPN